MSSKINCIDIVEKILKKSHYKNISACIIHSIYHQSSKSSFDSIKKISYIGYCKQQHKKIQ